MRQQHGRDIITMEKLSLMAGFSLAFCLSVVPILVVMGRENDREPGRRNSIRSKKQSQQVFFRMRQDRKTNKKTDRRISVGLFGFSP